MAPAGQPIIDILRQYLPLIIPLLAIQVILMIFALMDLARRERTKGPKWLWAIIIILGEILGPVLYLLIGREE